MCNRDCWGGGGGRSGRIGIKFFMLANAHYNPPPSSFFAIRIILICICNCVGKRALQQISVIFHLLLFDYLFLECSQDLILKKVSQGTQPRTLSLFNNIVFLLKSVEYIYNFDIDRLTLNLTKF